MFKRILSAIASALKAMFYVAGRVVTAPFRIVDAMLGGGSMWGLPELPTPSDVPATDAPAGEASRKDMELASAREANVVLGWAAESIIDDEPAPLPNPHRCSRATSSWLRGLTRDECELLINSDEKATSAHLRGRREIPGVRKVQPLEPAPWPPRERADCETISPGFAAVSADPTLSRA
jgi:hypothetical protein